MEDPVASISLDFSTDVDSYAGRPLRRANVAVVQPMFVLGGGTEAVAAWTVEALKADYNVSLVTFSRVDAVDLNRYYGTDLTDHQFSVISLSLPALLKHTKRFSLLKDHLMMRYCKSVKDRFDLFIGVSAGMDFGRRSLQYIGLAPASTLVKVLTRDPQMSRWFRLVKKSFMRVCELSSGYSEGRMRQNLTLVNSEWTGKLVEKVYGLRGHKVVYPPVGDPVTMTPWKERRGGFLCVARVAPEKRIEQALDIVKQIRDQGFDLSLRIVGRQDNRRYAAKIGAFCRKNSSWATFGTTLPRRELFSLMDQYKYGISTAPGEPFGIAVAEMMKAGCIVFVLNDGGQTEIAGVPELAFDDTEDAVKKITVILRSEELQERLLNRLKSRGSNFSSEAFCRGIRMAVRELSVGG